MDMGGPRARRAVSVSTLILEDGRELPLGAVPVAELVAAALACDEDERLPFVRALQRRADWETFAVARDLCGSVHGPMRAVGIDVLANLTGFGAAATPPILEVASSETSRMDDVQVARALGHALRNTGDARALQHLARLSEDPDTLVRWATASSLKVLISEFNVDEALDLLVPMTADPAPVIRDWACFELAMAGRATPAVRAALVVCLSDVDEVVRAQATETWNELFGDA